MATSLRRSTALLLSLVHSLTFRQAFVFPGVLPSILLQRGSLVLSTCTVWLGFVCISVAFESAFGGECLRSRADATCGMSAIRMTNDLALSLVAARHTFVIVPMFQS